ncbi:MAG: MlaD family protein [Bryobacteraceae bacterium]
MPSAQKVSWAQLRIGIMAAVAILIMAALVFLLTGSGDIFTKNVYIYTYLDDSAAMAAGSNVRLNGLLVGSIEDISFSGLKQPGKIVVIRMKIKKALLPQIPEDSEAGITAANLLGDKFINITKGKSLRPIQEGGTLKSLDVDDIPELMKRSGDILGQFQITLKRLDVIFADVEAGRGNLGKLLRDEELYRTVNGTVLELKKLVTEVSTSVSAKGKGTIARLLHEDGLYQEIRKPVARLDDVLAALQQGQGTAGKLLKDPALYDDARLTIADLRRVVQDLNDGKGTAGKLLKDEELYKRLNQIVARLDDTVQKVNAGQGTLGQLLVNPQLYESLNGSTRELQLLVKDIRANPKKFLRIKLAIF